MTKPPSFCIISIEGNIGSGKSTLLAHLKDNLKDDKIIFLKEPVDEWERIKDENGKTIIEKFYGDQERYSFPFQMMAYISRLSILKETIDKNPDSIIIIERSLYTDKYVFAKMLYDDGKIESVNYQIYLRWFETFSLEYPISKSIYVKADPENCYKRIIKRSRDGEDNIPLEYLISCDKYHDEMTNELIKIFQNHKQIKLDGNIDIYEDKDKLTEWINRIKELILSD